MTETYKTIIGLEVHIELSTKTKMFCNCPSDHFSKEPNTQTCPVCLGLPGALPFANQEAITKTIALGLALGSEVSDFSKFDRKHYFYPDLPKGYQISQYDMPLCKGGFFKIQQSKKEIRIKRIHLEEDTAKLVHEGDSSLIDFNRSGVALLELVTEPDFTDAQEVILFLKEIQLIARYLKVSNADMEKGSMRLEANVSVSKTADTGLPSYKVELKNINSFKFLERAINSEVERQKSILEQGKVVLQETRGFNEDKGETFSQREKEEAQDYRYFPEPDVPPLKIDPRDVNKMKTTMPELPQKKREVLSTVYGISEGYVEQLVSTPEKIDYFEKAIAIGAKHQVSPKTIADVLINKKMDDTFTEPDLLIKKILELTKRDFAGQEEVKKAVEIVIDENPKARNDYNSGKSEVVGFLVGMVQKKLKGKGNPQNVLVEIKRILEKK